MTNNSDFMLNTAFSAYNNNDLDQAEALSRQVLTVEPANGDALYLLGMIAYRAGALEPAEKLLYQAVKLYPNVESYALMLASVLEQKGSLDEALNFYRKYPENSAALVQTGLIQARRGQVSFAESAFQKALSLNPNTVAALVGLAQIARQQNEPEKALELLKKACDISPDYPDAWYQTAVQYRLQHNTDSALNAINRAIELSSLPVFFLEQGTLLEMSGQSDQAFNSYRHATDTDESCAEGWYRQGNILSDQNKPQSAESAYKRAIQIDPDFFESYHNLARLLYRQGRTTEALETFRKAVILNPTSDQAQYNLAVILEDFSEYSEALGLYFSVLSRQSPDMPPEIELRISSCLTYLYRQSKQGRQEAVRFAKGWVKHFPQSPVALHILASLTQKTSQNPEKYIQCLYNLFAETYDEKMHILQASVCDQMGQFIQDKKYKNVLDLGCGTGACGKLFKKNFNQLTGIDLSEKMLEKAKETHCYDHLIHDEINHFLTCTTATFDLVLAADVICYLPDLDNFFKNVKRVSEQNGLFVFSVETGDRDGLNESGRFLWCRDTVEKMLIQAGFNIKQSVETQLRRDGSGYAKGILFAVSS